MRRGDVVTVVAPGDFGKPRSAVIVQTDALTAAGAPSMVLCLISSHLVDAPAFRISVEPSAGNGLQQTSQIMVDKLVTVPRARVGKVIGHLDDETMLRLNRTLAFVIGLGQ
jgi:mRNA interferase MazF